MESSPQRICIVGGAGHVGLPLAMVLADENFSVDILDVNERALAMIESGQMPFLEEGAGELLTQVLASGRLRGTTETHIAREADIVICVIGTPVDEYLSPQTHNFFRVIRELQPHFRDGQTLVLRSTVYPGLSGRINEFFEQDGPRVHVTFCPERIAQGRSLREIREIPQIISGFDQEGISTVRALFSTVAREIIEVEPLEAELAKLFCNCYRYITFAIANQFYMLSRDVGADFGRIHHAASHHNPRTYTMPSAGFAAGPCLLKDTMQLAALSNNRFFLGHAAMLINEGQPQYLVSALKSRVALRDKCVCILGMTFKADCDDARDSLGFKLRKLLALEAREVIVTDPYLSGPGYYPLNQALEMADVVVVGVPHAEYRNLEVAQDKIVEDIWGCLRQRPGTKDTLRSFALAANDAAGS